MSKMSTYAPFPLDVGSVPPVTAHQLRWKHEALQLLKSGPTGDQRLTIFLHGMNGNWRSWIPLLRVGLTLDVSLGEVWLFDFTGARLPTTMLELDDLCEVIEAPLATGHFSEVRLIGHSTGGSLAAHMAARQKIRHLNSLTVLDGLFVELFVAAASRTRKQSNSASDRALRKLKVASSMGIFGEILLRRLSNVDAVRRAAGSLYAHANLLPRSVLDNTIDSFRATTLRDTLALGRRYEFERVYSNIAVPTRLILGDADPIMTVDDARIAEQLMPDLIWQVVEDCGHYPHIERPLETARLIWSASARTEIDS